MARRWDLPKLKTTLRRLNIDYKVIIPDVAAHLAEMKERHEQARAKSSRMDWIAYHTYDEVN